MKLLLPVLAVLLLMRTAPLPVLPVLVLLMLLKKQQNALSPSPRPRPWRNTAESLVQIVRLALQTALRLAASSPAPQKSLVHGGA